MSRHVHTALVGDPPSLVAFYPHDIVKHEVEPLACCSYMLAVPTDVSTSSTT